MWSHAARACERVDFESLLQERRPSAGDRVRREPGRVSGRCTSARARKSRSSAVSSPAWGPSDWSARYVAAVAARSYVRRYSATRWLAQDRESRVVLSHSVQMDRRVG